MSRSRPWSAWSSSLFERLGTVNAVLCFLADNHIQLGVRVREGPERGELSWRRPSRAGVQNILRNPAYAGIYAYGRSRVDPRRRQAGRPFTGRVRTAREDWIVFLPGLLPAYISIEQYEKNRQRMDANRSRSQSLGAVRDGPALLAGLVACGRCGKKMTVGYQRGAGGRQQPVYVCAREKSDYGAGQCQQLAGSCVDGYVTGLLLDAMAPAALEVSLAAAEQAGAQRAQVDRIWRQRLERADFAADRARRQYQLAEPENRLVVRQLEKDWEAALAERQRLGEEYDRFTATRPRTLTAAEREQIRALATDLPAVWNAPTTTDADRKQLIRHLIEQVRITVLGTSEKVDVEVTWAGGHRTAAQITRPVACLTQLSYYPQLAARARELADAGCTTAQIAERLNAEGFRPPKRIPAFTPNAVTDLLRALGIHRSPYPGPPQPPGAGPARVVAARPGRAPGHVRGHPRLLGPARLGHRLPAPGHQTDSGAGRPRRSRTAACPAPRAPGPAQPPSLAEKSRCLNEHRTGRSPQRCRPAAAMTALRLARLQVETAQERLPQAVHVCGRGAGG